MRILVAGCGYVGTRFAERMASRGHHVVGIRRQAPLAQRSAFAHSAFEVVAADLSDEASLRAALCGATGAESWDLVVYSASAGGRTEAAYRRAYVDGPRTLARVLDLHASRRAVFTSSTGVYAQTLGAWVDETSATEPTDPCARILLEAEEAFAEGPWRATVLRLGGIYGPGRTRLIDQVRSGQARNPAAMQYTNRIHRDDAAAALAHLAELDATLPVYVGVDEEPAAMHDVLRFLAEELGVGPVPAATVEPGDVSSRGNKRCRSARLRKSGFVFEYPTYREGYRALIAAAPASSAD